MHPQPTQTTLIYEGKAKRVFATDTSSFAIFEYKDDATAFNGQKHAQFTGKGALNNHLSAHLFTELAAAGVPNHFVRRLDDRRQLVYAVTIVPLEVIVRNRVAGSMARRFGREEGQRIPAPVVEWCLKDDSLGDPLFGPDHAVGMGLASWTDLAWMRRQALVVNARLGAIFGRVGIELVDFKIEFGRLAPSVGEAERPSCGPGGLILADEVSPDTCRLWDAKTGERLDKDRFRRDLAPLLEGYETVLGRLTGSPAHSDPVAQTGPVAHHAGPELHGVTE